MQQHKCASYPSFFQLQKPSFGQIGKELGGVKKGYFIAGFVGFF